MTQDIMEQARIEASAERATAVGLIGPLDVVRQGNAMGAATNKKLTDQLKRYMTLECLDRLDDDELGIAAVLQRRESTTYDLIAFAQQHPDWLVQLAVAGCLKVDGPALKGQRGKRAAVEELEAGYAMKGEEFALVIERRLVSDKREWTS